ncbi:MAG: HIT family protein [Bacteroidota bacterium]
MASIFTKIINGEIPCYKIAEDENYFAFLDVFPLAKGHVLVVPKKETDYIFDLEDETLAGLLVFAKRVALAMDKAVPCSRVGVAVIGLEVPHAHVHLVPLHSVEDINFSRPKMKLEKDEMEAIAAHIRQHIA